MKKTLILGMALGLALTATSALAVGSVPGGGGIVGSFHDLSAYGDAQQRICVFCHHPHKAQKANDAGDGMTGVDYSPLWNHDITTNVGNFTPYSNGAGPTSGRNALNAVSTGPGGASLLCLSCHDGSVALNAYSSFSTSKDAGVLTPSLTLALASRTGIGVGGDLSNHHPVGFNYQDVVALDAEIADPTKTINATSATTIGDLLYNGTQMECVTCHDVHNSQNTGAEKFLWTTNDGSAFCLVCHEKAGVHTNSGY